MANKKARCEQVTRWLTLNLGRGALAPLTGTDMRALAAASHLIELYAVVSRDLEDSVLNAFHDVVMCMQPSTREFAYHSIAQVLDWPDRAKIWARAGLPPFDSVRRLAGEN